ALALELLNRKAIPVLVQSWMKVEIIISARYSHAAPQANKEDTTASFRLMLLSNLSRQEEGTSLSCSLYFFYFKQYQGCLELVSLDKDHSFLLHLTDILSRMKPVSIVTNHSLLKAVTGDVLVVEEGSLPENYYGWIAHILLNVTQVLKQPLDRKYLTRAAGS